MEKSDRGSYLKTALLCSRGRRAKRGAALAAALLLTANALAADVARTHALEAAWRSAGDLDGDVVELSAGDRSALAIHRPAAGRERRGGVILIHGRGTNADSRETLHPLRIGLSDAGWDTLSIQLPAAYDDADAADWLATAPAIEARLGAALDWMSKQGIDKRVVVGVGDSATIALRFAASRGSDEVAAVAMISSPATFDDDAVRDVLSGLARPLFDLYAQRDLTSVTANAERRAAAARAAGLADFVQRDVPGAGPGFRGLDAALVAAARTWLNARVAKPAGTAH